MLEFVRSEKREYQGNILTELRDVTEAWSLTLNVVFFYKSNWQNELLRLQRRNKFICALMIAMQEHGIEGPRRNQAGWHSEQPIYLNVPSGLPPYTAAAEGGNGNGPNGQQSISRPHDLPSSPAVQPQQSILHQRRGSSFSTRARGESLSQMGKRVDFSLGMRDISSGDQLGDIYEDRSRTRVTDTIRDSNRVERERRILEETIDENGEVDAGAQTTSHDRGPLQMAGGLIRRSTTFGPRSGSVSSDTHRNRFFGRRGRGPFRPSLDLQRQEEEGQAGMPASLDPRSGYTGSQAVRTDSTTSEAIPFPSLSSGPGPTRDWELQPVSGRP